ncbi:MAG: hypothetical protein U0525_00770 [Patescibacteria group bacterium]
MVVEFEYSSIHPGFTPQYFRSSVEQIPGLETRIDNFHKSLGEDEFVDRYGNKQLGYQYKQDSIDLISYSTNLARAYNLNEHIDRRLRRFDKYPYMDHPLEMAEEGVRMRLHPTIISALLLHDVAEDVRLRNLSTPDAWMKFFERAYDGYEDKDRLMRILKAELKTESLAAQFPDEAERKQVVDLYTNTPTGQTALGYLKELRAGKVVEGETEDQKTIKLENDKLKIAEVLFDLNNIFSESYIPDGKGGMVFDPSILIVKILDTWQNLKTPGFWGKQLLDPNKEAATVAKLIRARILTNVAEFFGMRRVASDMTKALATVHDINLIDLPGLKDLLTKGLDRTYFDKRMQLQEDAMGRANGEEKDAISKHLVVENNDSAVSTPPRIEAVFQMPYGDPPSRSSDNIVHIVSSNPFHPTSFTDSINDGDIITSGVPLSVTDGYLRPALQTALGRNTEEYLLYDSNRWPESSRRIRFENTDSRIISSAKAREHKKTRVVEAPEYALFHPGACRYSEKDLGESGPYTLKTHSGKVIDTRLTNLMDFMLSPHKFVSNGHNEETRSYVIIVRKKDDEQEYSEVYFANNKTDVTVHDIATRAGVTNPKVRALESDIWNKVVEGDHDVLNRMKNGEGDVKPQIGQYNVVVVEENVDLVKQPS